jgi:ketosteroid isomerase-like protein
MTDRKIEIVQDVYAAFGRGDVEHILAQLTDDVDWASCPGSDVAPWHGVHKGKGEVPAFFRALAENLQITEFTPLSFAANETDVMVVTHFAATAPATGKSAEMDIHHWWRFRGDQIYRYRGTEDTARTAEVLRAG